MSTTSLQYYTQYKKNFIIQKYTYNFVLQNCTITLYYKVFIEVQCLYDNIPM